MGTHNEQRRRGMSAGQKGGLSKKIYVLKHGPKERDCKHSQGVTRAKERSIGRTTGTSHRIYRYVSKQRGERRKRIIYS